MYKKINNRKKIIPSIKVALSNEIDKKIKENNKTSEL